MSVSRKGMLCPFHPRGSELLHLASSVSLSCGETLWIIVAALPCGRVAQPISQPVHLLPSYPTHVSCRIYHIEVSQPSGMVVINGQVMRASLHQKYKPKVCSVWCLLRVSHVITCSFYALGTCCGQPIIREEEMCLKGKVAFLYAQTAGGTPGWARLRRTWSGRINITGPCCYLVGRTCRSPVPKGAERRDRL